MRQGVDQAHSSNADAGVLSQEVLILGGVLFEETAERFAMYLQGGHDTTLL